VPPPLTSRTQHAERSGAEFSARALPPPEPPFEIRRPARWAAPVVVCSPHSGSLYPPDLVAAARIGGLDLRLSEDAFVDGLFAAAPALGLPLLRATFARAYIDLNREAYELDPAMFEDVLPKFVRTRSDRLTAGLGTIPRVTAEGLDIYARRLRFAEADGRIAAVYRPYHEALRDLIAACRRRFGVCVLIDAHSMPSRTAAQAAPWGRGDVVLGDRHGRSCAAAISDAADTALTGMGYRVVRNRPYAGGFTTEHYAAPARGIHALQVEIDRGLYMNESTLEPTSGFDAVAADMGMLLRIVAEVSARLPEIS